MKRLLFGILAIAILLTGCASEPAEAAPTIEKTLRVGLMPDDGILPYLYGAQQGYFEEEGITVSFEIFMSALDRDAALQAGELDAIYSDVISLLYYAEAGTPLQAVSNTQATYGIAVQKTPDGISSLKGQSVGLSTNTLMEYLVDLALAKEGLTEDEIEKIAIPSLPNRLESYRAGQISAIALPEPLLSLAVLANGQVIETAESIDLDPGVLLVKETWLNDSADSMSNFFAAYDRAVEGLNAGAAQEDLLEIYTQAKFPDPVIETFVLPNYHLAQAPSPEEIQKAIDWLTARDLIEGEHSYDSLVSPLLQK
jgi:NitT/TauT family transport system substrate-binding protein